MGFVESVSAVTGAIVIVAILVFTCVHGVKSVYQLIFKPVDYIKCNHSGMIDEMLHGHYGERMRKIIDASVLETLRETGIYRNIDKQKSVHLILTKTFIEAKIKSQFVDYRINLLKIIKKNSQKVQAKVGKGSVSVYSHYVNLRRILPNSEDAAGLSYILAGFIYEDIESQGKGYDFLAVNRNGNAILGYLISNFLSLPLVIVNYDSRWVLGGDKVDVDGLDVIPRLENKRGFLIDDAVSGGTILKDSCNVLRSKGLQVCDAYVLFSRKEDGAIADFKNQGINLHSIFDLNDQSIEKILSTEDENLNSIINGI